jgi:hypothetical protein
MWQNNGANFNTPFLSIDLTIFFYSTNFWTQPKKLNKIRGKEE